MKLPPVPPLDDHRLEAFLDAVRRILLQTTADKDGDGQPDSDIAAPLGFEPIPDTTATLAGFGEVEDTEDAWTTVSSGAPAGARYAMILFEVASTDNADVGDLAWRTESGGIETTAVVVDGDEDDAQPRLWFFVPLTSSGNFDYKFTNAGATTIDWHVYYIGYVL